MTTPGMRRRTRLAHRTVIGMFTIAGALLGWWAADPLPHIGPTFDGRTLLATLLTVGALLVVTGTDRRNLTELRTVARHPAVKGRR